jgi:hypothetical protein
MIELGKNVKSSHFSSRERGFLLKQQFLNLPTDLPKSMCAGPEANEKTYNIWS